MKRIMTIIAVMATILASCSKSEPEADQKNVNENCKIKINLSVSELSSGDSKALIKTDWVSGDKLQIWFDSNVGVNPDLVIQYNGSKWEQVSASVSGKKPSTSGGYMKALYNNTLIVTAKDPYKYDDNTLTGRIETWTFLTEIQVVVSDITKDAVNYTLSCDKFTPCTGYTVGEESIIAKAGKANTPVNAISNADGAAFVFASCTEYDTETTFSFSLNDGTYENSTTVPSYIIYNGTPTEPSTVTIGGVKWAACNIGASEPYQYGYYFSWGDTEGYIYGPAYAPKKALAKDVKKINALKISNSKFEKKWFNAKNGEVLSGGFCWENAPFGKEGISYVMSEVCPDGTLVKKYDAAYKYFGGSWHMPTKENFISLVKACVDGDYSGGNIAITTVFFSNNIKGKGVYYCSNYSSGAKIPCIIFCDGESSLCFPVAGYGEDNKYIDKTTSHHWTNKLDVSSNANAFNLMGVTGNVNATQINGRNLGFPIRPVSD